MRPSWREHRRILLHNGVVYSPAQPFSTALLIDGDTVAWIGEDTAAQVHQEAVDLVVDLQGALVTTGFVDAHVHATSTGLLLTGLDLTDAGSGVDVVDRLRAFARQAPGAPILGHGWDETRWSDRTLPSREDIDRAADGAPVYLSRIDVHSALVSTSLIDAVAGVTDLDGWQRDSALSRAAHIRVRERALGGITVEQRRQAQGAMRAAAARVGIVAVHEMAGPGISSEDDLSELMALAEESPGPLVFGYWGQLADEGGIETARRLGAVGVAGDLFIDGAIGSRTACLHEAYRDASDVLGASYLDADQVTRHLIAATEAGLQGGFHVIGDAASAMISTGLERASVALGEDAIRRAGHRLEHAEMLSDRDIDVMVRLGVTASMQPMFDGHWGGPNGMYVERLGADRAAGMNRFADIAAAGGLLAFGSDAPVTSLGPWSAVRAAVHHTNPAQRISTRAAFSAHTRAGWRAVGQPGAGVLAPGADAHLAIWHAEELDVHVPDGRVSAWSTDPRSGTPGLPVLDADASLPECLATIVAGRLVHSSDAVTWD